MKSIVSKIKQPVTLLNHILDQEQLPAIVQSLDARTLTKLIRYVGLEDSAPIVSLATAEQLERVLDEDLWYSEAPGQDEIFDADRFGLWLEIMEESGSDSASGSGKRASTGTTISGLVPQDTCGWISSARISTT